MIYVLRILDFERERVMKTNPNGRNERRINQQSDGDDDENTSYEY